MTQTPESEPLPVTEETQVHRYKWLQRTTREDLHDVLDAGLVAHIGFVRDGKPVVIPMGYVRQGDHLLMHGSSGAGLNKHANAGVDLCATVSVLDGLVFAQSLFDSTLNYRCAVVMGTAVPVPEEQKETAVRAISERLMPGRWDEVRAPLKKELAATYVLQLPLANASVKIRDGHPDDEPAAEVWTGFVPFDTTTAEPVTQPGVTAPMPASVSATLRRFQTSIAASG